MSDLVYLISAGVVAVPMAIHQAKNQKIERKQPEREADFEIESEHRRPTLTRGILGLVTFGIPGAIVSLAWRKKEKRVDKVYKTKD